MDQQTSKVVGGDVVGGDDKNETREITHSIQKVRLTAAVSNLARGPEVDMENAEGAWKSSMTEWRGQEGIGLNNNGGHQKQV